MEVFFKNIRYICTFRLTLRYKAKFNQQKNLRIKERSISINNYICNRAILFNNVHLIFLTQEVIHGLLLNTKKAYGTVQLSEVIVAGTKQNATKQNDNISNEKNE